MKFAVALRVDFRVLALADPEFQRTVISTRLLADPFLAEMRTLTERFTPKQRAVIVNMARGLAGIGTRAA